MLLCNTLDSLYHYKIAFVQSFYIEVQILFKYFSQFSLVFLLD